MKRIKWLLCAVFSAIVMLTCVACGSVPKLRTEGITKMEDYGYTVKKISSYSLFGNIQLKGLLNAISCSKGDDYALIVWFEEAKQATAFEGFYYLTEDKLLSDIGDEDTVIIYKTIGNVFIVGTENAINSFLK